MVQILSPASVLSASVFSYIKWNGSAYLSVALRLKLGGIIENFVEMKKQKLRERKE